MKKEEINRLLEKYYKGESSESEEVILRTYFTGSDVSEEFSEEKIIFSYYSSVIEVPEPSEGFESSIIDAVNKSSEVNNRKILPNFSRALIGIAAGLMLLIGSYFFFSNRSSVEDTFTDPQLAYAETMKILREVSVKMNKGYSSMEPVGKIEKSTGSVGKHLNSIKLLQPAFNLATQPDDYK